MFLGFLIYADAMLQDVSLAVLFVSTKMQDTLKKPRDLMSVSYSIRFPELAAKSKHPTGDIDLDTMDPQVCSKASFLPATNGISRS